MSNTWLNDKINNTFNFHRLVAKKKENYRKMLEECKGIELDSSWKEIKKIIKDDPR